MIISFKDVNQLYNSLKKYPNEKIAARTFKTAATEAFNLAAMQEDDVMNSTMRFICQREKLFKLGGWVAGTSVRAMQRPPLHCVGFLSQEGTS